MSSQEPATAPTSMELPIAGLSIAVLAQLRIAAQSIVARIENYRKGPEEFKSLSENLAILKHNIEEVDKGFLKLPNERLKIILPLFEKSLDSVRQGLVKSEATIEEEFSKVFSGSSKSLAGMVRSQVRRVVRATDLSKKMTAVESQIKESAASLERVSTGLASALNSLELHTVVIPQLGNLAISESAGEEYKPAISAPTPSHTVKLNFVAKDAGGHFATPEGMLKHKVKSSASSAPISAATGIVEFSETLPPACGVVGMAGVGKTIALQGLARQEDICLLFPGGVLYMTLGQGATERDAVSEIVKIMKITGASSSIAAVTNATTLKEAVDHAVVWFRDQKCLFLVDDIWPTDRCPIGCLKELRQLLRCSPESRMAISTRSVNIAIGAGAVVDFAARDTFGPVAVSIFMACAGQGLRQDLFPNASKILGWCWGLPIALSVTGSSVACLVRDVGSFERACEVYVADFEETATILGEEQGLDGTRLNDCIRLSLKYLQVEFSEWKKREAVHIEHNISDLYTSLCVLTNQLWVPVSALGRLWKLDGTSALNVAKIFSGFSLASLSYRKIGGDGTEQAGLTLHDLHLEFCKMQAKSKKAESLWHSSLLNGYTQSSSKELYSDPFVLTAQKLVRLQPRSWWSDAILEDGYMHANLARHLSLCGFAPELALVLLDARWLNVRGKLGGILGIGADFDVLDKLLQPRDSCGEENVSSTSLRLSFQLLLKAMKLSWGSFSDGSRALQFQMCGRLLRLRKNDIVVDAVVSSFEAHTPRPFLMPLTCLYPDMNSAQILEIPVGGRCYCVACSPCGRYVAAGSGCDIVIADAVTGDILKRFRSPGKCSVDYVLSIQFCPQSKKLVSSFADGMVAVWEWELSDSPILVLTGHSDFATCVAVSSDGSIVFSGSRDGTLRLWNAGNGFESDKFVQCCEVWSVAILGNDKRVAIGLRCGTLKVLDSHTGATVFQDSEAHAYVIGSLALSSDGQRLATCSWDSIIRIWNTEKWEAIGLPVKSCTGAVRSVAFSPNRQQLVSASEDGIIRLWDVTPESSVGGSSHCPVLSERAMFPSEWVKSVAFTYDGERIISATGFGTVCVWDARFDSDEQQRSFSHTGEVHGVSISHDGLRVASASSGKTVRLWNTQTGAEIGNPLEGHAKLVYCVSFSPCGRFVLSGSWDKTMRLWDTKLMTQIGNPFEGQISCVWSASFSSDGLRVVSGDSDKTIRLWNVQTRDQIGDHLIGHPGRVESVAESFDGRFVVSRDENRETIIWNRDRSATISGSEQDGDIEAEGTIRDRSAIVWRSEQQGNIRNTITDIEAENVIRSCGHETPHLWPFPGYTAEVYSDRMTLYSNRLGQITPLGNLPSRAEDWKYDAERKVFAAALTSGAVAICRLLGELEVPSSNRS